MSHFTKELLKHLTYVGSASRRLIDTNNLEKKAPTQQKILDILVEENGLEQGVLAEILDIRPSSLTEVLNKLENRGEIRREEDTQDKRIKRIYITDAGLEKATPATERHDRSTEFFAGISEDEQQELDRLLDKIVSGWEEDFGEGTDIPNTPFDTIESMKDFYKQYAQEYMEDMQHMSARERKQLQRDMRRNMRDQMQKIRNLSYQERQEWKQKMRDAMGDMDPHHFNPMRGFRHDEFDPKKPGNSDDFDESNEDDWENW